ncbi:MAG: hypothetical protein IJP01_01385, partial [Oscillospiraceae bacterium]|nr:hypothetical protein [Oscillospiraceae bacterium]
PEPMVFVSGGRFMNRAPEERNVIVYTNCENVTLVVNGVEVETKAAVDLADGIGLDDVMGLMGSGSGMDLADGVGLDDVAGLAAGLLGDSQKSGSSKKGGVDLTDGIGLDDVLGLLS